MAEKENSKGVKMANRLGVDPGINGAIALLNGNQELIEVFDMPIMALSKGKNQVNAAALVCGIKELIDKGYTPMMAYLEMASSMPGQGVSSMFSFGMSYGIVQGVLAAMGIPVVLVRPASWKAKAGLRGKDKDMARTLAQRLYPLAPLGRKKDIGQAEAILIAKYGG